MDDPLIALTLWQNDSSSKVKKPGRPHRVECPPVVLDSNKQVAEGEEGRRSKKERARGLTSSKKDQSPKKPSGGKKSLKKGGEELDNCFPCLPGMEDEKELHDSPEPPFSPVQEEKEPLSDDGRTSPDIPKVVDSNMLLNSPVPQPQNFWLMRLFQSKLFNMSIAIGYLFNSKEADVQAYLGNKLYVSPSDVGGKGFVVKSMTIKDACDCWGQRSHHISACTSLCYYGQSSQATKKR